VVEFGRNQTTTIPRWSKAVHDRLAPFDPHPLRQRSVLPPLLQRRSLLDSPAAGGHNHPGSCGDKPAAAVACSARLDVPSCGGGGARMNTPGTDMPRTVRRRWRRALLVVAALLAVTGTAVVAARWFWPGRATSVPGDEELQAVYDTPFGNAHP